MKAIYCTRYGPPEVLKVRDMDKPTPKPNEVLIRIHAANVSAGDCEMRGLKLPFPINIAIRLYLGPVRPTRISILGQEFAGVVEAVGGAVTRYRPGDPVMAATGFGFGAYGEYICLAEDPATGALSAKPANLSFAEAAAVPVGALEAWYFLRQAALQPGQSILINGAGGSIGTIALQIAKHEGARVICVDRDEKLAMLRAIGAERVIDYAREDFTREGGAYDVILDVTGKSSFTGCIRALKPAGRYLLSNARLSQILRGRRTSRTSAKQVICGSASYNTADLQSIKDLIEAGVIKPVIDRCFPLDDIVDAHKYVESGRKAGNVVVTMSDSASDRS